MCPSEFYPRVQKHATDRLIVCFKAAALHVCRPLHAHPPPSVSLPPFRFICSAIRDAVAGTQASRIPQMAPKRSGRAENEATCPKPGNMKKETKSGRMSNKEL